MPGYNGRGPAGDGPRTGGRRGYCGSNNKYRTSEEPLESEVSDDESRIGPVSKLGRGPCGRGLARKLDKDSNRGEGRGFGRGQR